MENKMQKDYLKNINLTIVSNYLPRFDVGSSNTRIYHLVKLLSNMGIYITYIYFYTSLDDTRYIKSIAEVKTIRLNGSPHEHVQNILASKPDILWLTNLWTPIFFESMSQLMNNVRNRRPEVKIILDTMDLHAKKYHRRYAITRSPDDLFTAKKFLDLEKTNYPNADAVVVVTEDEKNDILGLKLDSPSIYVIPNIHQISTVNTPYDQRGDLVYLGNFNINHNIDAVLHFVKVIFPYVSKKYPKLRLHILGREADTKLSQLAGPTICVHGFVHDLEKALTQFRVFICPMTYGAGMKGKLGEAMANGLPIVTTTIGAEGFDLIDGENCFIADFPEEFAQKTIQLYENEILWNNFSTNCKNLIQQNFSYEPVAKLLRELIFSFKPANILLTHEQAGNDFENKPLNKNILTSNSFTTVHKIESYLSNINWLHKLFDYSSHFDYAEIINDNKIPVVSVIIISWRLHPDTTNCLQILKKQRTQPFEIIFVDNGSDLGIFDALKPDIDTYVRLSSNSGAYLARNIGSIFAKSPILFFLDDDAIPADNIIESHLNSFKKYDVIAVRGACKPKTKNPLNYLQQHYYLGDRPYPRFGDLEGNMSYQADNFYRVGGWDDNIQFGHGGIDLSWRLLEIDPDMRKQIYNPDPIIFHDYATGEHHLRTKREKQAKSWQYLLNKNGPNFKSFLASWDKFRANENSIIKNIDVTLPPSHSFINLARHYFRKGDMKKYEHYIQLAGIDARTLSNEKDTSSHLKHTTVSTETHPKKN
jgi:glycosyltransferase involved in cell wall biosynthesis/GT2 family glycosyltransferase